MDEPEHEEADRKPLRPREPEVRFLLCVRLLEGEREIG